MEGHDTAFLLGVIVGAGSGFLIAMWFQTSIVMKFKEALQEWFEEDR